MPEDSDRIHREIENIDSIPSLTSLDISQVIHTFLLLFLLFTSLFFFFFSVARRENGGKTKDPTPVAKEVMQQEGLLRASQGLKEKLIKWESKFVAKEGRKPTKQDVPQHPKIGGLDHQTKKKINTERFEM